MIAIGVLPGSLPLPKGRSTQRAVAKDKVTALDIDSAAKEGAGGDPQGVIEFVAETRSTHLLPRFAFTAATLHGT